MGYMTMHSWLSLWIGAEMVSFNFKKTSCITITSTCLDPYKHHKSSNITHQAPPLTDPFGFHLTLQRDPGGSQRLAAALWMSPHSTLCGDEIYGERLEFVVPLMKMGEDSESEVVLNSGERCGCREEQVDTHTQAMMVGIIACKSQDIIVSCIWWECPPPLTIGIMTPSIWGRKMESSVASQHAIAYWPSMLPYFTITSEPPKALTWGSICTFSHIGYGEYDHDLHESCFSILISLGLTFRYIICSDHHWTIII